MKYYLYGLYPDSTTIFNISVKMKCKQTNPRFLTNVTTSGDIAHAYFGWFLKWTRKNCFRYLKLMSPLNENTFLKNNYLTLRSKVKVSRKSLWYATHHLMVMHPHTKYNWPIWKNKKSYGPDKLRWKEAEEAEAEDKIRLKQYVCLRSKGRHNKRKILFWKFSKLKVIHSPSK